MKPLSKSNMSDISDGAGSSRDHGGETDGAIYKIIIASLNDNFLKGNRRPDVAGLGVLPWEAAGRGFPPGFTVADLARTRRRPGPTRPDNIRARAGHIVNLCSEYARSFQPPEEVVPPVKKAVPARVRAAVKTEDTKAAVEQANAARLAEQKETLIESAPDGQPKSTEAKSKTNEDQPPLTLGEDEEEVVESVESEDAELRRRRQVEGQGTEGRQGAEDPGTQLATSAHVPRAHMARRRDLAPPPPTDPLGTHMRSPISLRRPTSLTRDGAQLAALRAARRPELTRRSTSLKMEGEMSTVTTNQEFYQPHGPRGRRHSKRVPTVLKSEGEMLKTTESHEQFVVFPEIVRPALLRRHSCLRLEGSYAHAPEYNEIFRGVPPEERAVSRRRPDQLKLEGAVADKSETRASFSEEARLEGVRRESGTRKEGRLGGGGRKEEILEGVTQKEETLDKPPRVETTSVGLLDLGLRYEPTKRYPGEKRHAARVPDKTLGGDEQLKEDRRRREHIFDGNAMKAVMGDVDGKDEMRVREPKGNIFVGNEMKAVMDDAKAKEARRAREEKDAALVGMGKGVFGEALNKEDRGGKETKDNIFEGREMKAVMHDMQVAGGVTAQAQPRPAPKVDPHAAVDQAYREIFVDIKRELDSRHPGREPTADNASVERRKSQPRMPEPVATPKPVEAPPKANLTQERRAPRRPRPAETRRQPDIFPTTPADALRSRRPSAEFARSRPVSPEPARTGIGRKEFVDYSCKESLGGVRTRVAPRTHLGVGAERFTAFQVLGKPDAEVAARERSPSPSYRLLVVPVDGREGRPRFRASDHGSAPRSPARTVSGSTTTNTGSGSANRSLTPTKSPRSPKRSPRSPRRSPRSPRRSPKSRKSSPVAASHAFLVLDGNNNDAGRSDDEICQRKTYLELPGGDALGGRKEVVDSHWMAPWYENPTSS